MKIAFIGMVLGVVALGMVGCGKPGGSPGAQGDQGGAAQQAASGAPSGAKTGPATPLPGKEPRAVSGKEPRVAPGKLGKALSPGWLEGKEPLGVHASSSRVLVETYAFKDGKSHHGVVVTDLSGTELWNKSWPAHNLTAALAEDGKVALAGWLEKGFDLGDGPVQVETKGETIFVAVFDPKGKPIWHKVFPVLSRFDALAFGADGSLTASGDNDGYKLDLGGGALPESKGGLTVARWDAGGKHLFSRVFSANRASAMQMRVDGSGATRIAGSFDGKFSLGKINLAGANDGAHYLLKLSPEGEPVWARRVEADRPLRQRNAAVFAGDDTYFVGDFWSPLGVDSTVYKPVGEKDLAVIKIGADGKTAWVKTFGTPGDEQVFTASEAPAGGVALVGWYKGAMAFGSLKLSSGGHAVFAAALGADGAPRWAETLSSFTMGSGGVVPLQLHAYTVGSQMFLHGTAKPDTYKFGDQTLTTTENTKGFLATLGL